MSIVFRLGLEAAFDGAFCGLVFLRGGGGGSAALAISAISRSRASSRLRSWVRKRLASIRISPSLVPSSGVLEEPTGYLPSRPAHGMKAQLYGSRNLVDVSPARPGGTNEASSSDRSLRIVRRLVMRMMFRFSSMTRRYTALYPRHKENPPFSRALLLRMAACLQKWNRFLIKHTACVEKAIPQRYGSLALRPLPRDRHG